MALLKFGALVTGGSGSLGGHTIQHSKGGMQLRNKPVPRSAPTDAQRTIRLLMLEAQHAWLSLSDVQRSHWNQIAPHPLAGHSYFIKTYALPSADYLLNGNILDNSYNHYHGINMGGVPALGHTGAPDSSMYFGVTGNYAITPFSFNGLTRFTVSAWYKRFAANSLVYSAQGADQNTGFELGLYINGFLYIGVGNNIFGDAPAAGTDWYHLVMQFDNNALTRETRLIGYINSIKQTLGWEGVGLPENDNKIGTLDIGRRFAAPLFNSNGYIDDFKIYPRLLSAAEILKLYNS